MSIPVRPVSQATARAVAHSLPYGLHAPARVTLRQRLAAILERWAAGPRRSHNRHALVYVGIVGLLTIGLTWNVADRAMAWRLIGLALFALHVLANKLIVAALAALRDRGMPEAGRALDVYLGPGQMTSLEIALIWLGFTVFAPLVDVLAPTGASLAG